MINPKFGKAQSGFLLVTVLAALIIMGVVGIYKAKELVMSTNQSLADATGKYMVTVRGAVLRALGDYEAAFAQVDTSGAPAGTYPTFPAWSMFTGDSQTIMVKDLKDSGLLSADFPERSPLGRSVYVRFLRTPGICPGVGCQIQAFVVSCWPISTPVTRTAFDPLTCPAAPANLQFSEILASNAMKGADSYGGTNVLDPAIVHGPLMDIPATALGIPAGSAGHLVVVASLNATPFPQFVRQGDIRKIRLNNTLTVAGTLTTETGLLIDTEVVIGSACTDEGMYATSSRGSWSECTGGQWFELTGHVVTSALYLANGATIVPPVCPGANMEAFSYASLSHLDTTMTGTDVNVRGDMAGSITGAGVVSQSGNVSVSGTYTGKVVSSPDSSIRVAQSADVVSGQLVISPASPEARALVIQGCRYRG